MTEKGSDARGRIKPWEKITIEVNHKGDIKEEFIMKKLFAFIFAAMLLIVPALPADAASRAELEEEQRNQLDTFFSNFAEARVETFVMNNELPMDTLVDFGVMHNIINRKYDLVDVNEGFWGVKKEAVEAAVYKYFGRSIEAVSSRRHPITNDLYLIPKASGEAFTFAQIDEWNSSGDGVWTGTVNVYTASSGFTGDVHMTYPEGSRESQYGGPKLTGHYSFTVTTSPEDPDRYVLVDWLKL